MNSAQEEQSPGITLHRKQDEDWRQTRSQRPIAGAGSADPGRFRACHHPCIPAMRNLRWGPRRRRLAAGGLARATRAWLKCARVADSSGVPASLCQTGSRPVVCLHPDETAGSCRPARSPDLRGSSAPPRPLRRLACFQRIVARSGRRIPKSLLTRQSARLPPWRSWQSGAPPALRIR